MRRSFIAGILGSILTLSVPARAGEWATADSLTFPRAMHSATLLEDGRLLLAGGLPHLAGQLTVKIPELWGPAPEWTSGVKLNSPRFEHVAARLPNGNVLIAGGQDWHEEFNTTELFDPKSGKWSPGGVIVVSRLLATATTLIDGRVLLVGGRHGSEGIATNRVEIYDPTTDKWADGSDMHTSRVEHTATLLPDGRVLVVGGFVNYRQAGAREDAEIYDPDKNTWTLTSKLNERRGAHTAALLLDGRVLVAGGARLDGVDEWRSSAEIYDPVKNTWSLAAPMHQARAEHATAMLRNGHVLVAGGRAVDMLSHAETYDPVANTWTEQPPMHASRTYFTASQLPDGRVLVAGGSTKAYAESASRASVEIYTPDTGTTCASPSDCRSGFCVEGICCDSACEGDCAACTHARGAVGDGICTAVPRGADGVCQYRCSSAQDCTLPYVCSTEGVCAPPPAVDSDHSGCRLPAPAPTSRWPAAAFALAVIAAAARRRRRA